MLLRATFAAIRQVVSQPLRRILWRSLGLTVLILILAWVALTRGAGALLAAYPVSVDYPVLDGFVYFLTGFGLVVALAYVLPAVTALVAGYFLDDAALVVEQTDFPADVPGRALSLGRSLAYGLRFAALSLVVNLVALILFFIPGVNLTVFFAANAYLFGREYFEMAASRFMTGAEASRLRRENRVLALSAGALIAGWVLVPLVNLTTPLFGIALMVHVVRHVRTRRPRIMKVPTAG